MEGGGHDVALLDQDGEAVAGGENFDAVAGFHDAGRADVDHFKRAAGKLRVAGLDGGVDLAAVGVALDGGVEDAEALLRRVRDFSGEKDASGAGAEGGLVRTKSWRAARKPSRSRNFRNVVDSPPGMMRPSMFGELLWFADEDGVGTGFAQGLGVGIVIALDGEDADLWSC